MSRPRTYGLLDMPDEAQLNAAVRAAVDAFRAPSALISLVDADCQWLQAR